jgi:hypothetical protein
LASTPRCASKLKSTSTPTPRSRWPLWQGKGALKLEYSAPTHRVSEPREAEGTTWANPCVDQRHARRAKMETGRKPLRVLSRRMEDERNPIPAISVSYRRGGTDGVSLNQGSAGIDVNAITSVRSDDVVENGRRRQEYINSSVSLRRKGVRSPISDGEVGKNTSSPLAALKGYNCEPRGCPAVDDGAGRATGTRHP